MIYKNNMAVEEVIKQSVKDAKQANQRKRREWVRRMLNYYGEIQLISILRIILILLLFKKFLAIMLILQDDL